MKDLNNTPDTAATARRVAEAVETLGQDHAGLNARLEEEKAAVDSNLNQAARSAATHAIAAMQMIAQFTIQSIQAQEQAVHDARYALRKFMADSGIYRPLHIPNILVTLLTLMVGTIFEAIFTTLSLYADGHMDLIPAMGFALTFAIVTTILGLAAGSILRFVSYRSKLKPQTSGIRAVRWFARLGFLLIVAVTALMVFVGGRVRVTGQHQDIFNVSEVSFAATFNDGMALVIMVAATLSFLLSISKGYSGFTDPVPGYAAHAGKADADYADEIGWIVATTLDSIDTIFERACASILESERDPEMVDDLRQDILGFNASVKSTKADVTASALDDWEQHCFATGVETPAPDIDLASLDELIIDVDRLPIWAPPEGLMDDILQVQAEAHAKVLAAQEDFANSLQGFRVSPPST